MNPGSRLNLCLANGLLISFAMLAQQPGPEAAANSQGGKQALPVPPSIKFDPQQVRSPSKGSNPIICNPGMPPALDEECKMMRAEVEAKGWHFKVGWTGVLDHPIDQLIGLVVPEDADHRASA